MKEFYYPPGYKLGHPPQPGPLLSQYHNEYHNHHPHAYAKQFPGGKSLLQAQLGEMLDVSKGAIYLWETEKIAIDTHKLTTSSKDEGH